MNTIRTLANKKFLTRRGALRHQYRTLKVVRYTLKVARKLMAVKEPSACFLDAVNEVRFVIDAARKSRARLRLTRWYEETARNLGWPERAA